MNCREFKSKHVGYIDDLLPAADMLEMRRHILACSRCESLDIRIRRSLLVMRNLPQIEPSADFFSRLNEALKEAPPPERAGPTARMAASFVMVTAALAAAVYFAMAFSTGRPGPEVTSAPTASAVAPVSDITLATAAPAGVPIWPAMFMLGELPMQMASADLLDYSLAR